MSRTLLVTPEMEATAREVLDFPHFKPGAKVPFFMRRQARLLEFARLMADAVLGTETPPIERSPEPIAEESPAGSSPVPVKPVEPELPTVSQMEALKRAPQDWFSPAALKPSVHGPVALCQRMTQRGLLETREAGPDDNVKIKGRFDPANIHYNEYRLSAWGECVLAKRKENPFFLYKGEPSPWAKQVLADFLVQAESTPRPS